MGGGGKKKKKKKLFKMTSTWRVRTKKYDLPLEQDLGKKTKKITSIMTSPRKGGGGGQGRRKVLVYGWKIEGQRGAFNSDKKRHNSLPRKGPREKEGDEV